VKETTTKEQIMKAINECAKELGHAPSIGELQKMKGVAKAMIYTKFGNYRSALALCGLERSGPGYQTDLKSLFLDWAGLARRLGKLPTMGDYEAHAKYSIQPLLRRYGIWGDVPAGVAKYAKAQGLEREWADVMEIIARGRSSVRGKVRSSAPMQGGLREDQLVYGTPLTYLPLTYAPTNESGVIFLFGAMAYDLGFAVSHIQGAFPDCLAMRRVGPEKWQPRRVEFEFESRNFLLHGHDLKGCDIIVCWKHNWEDCPLEVIELSKELQKWRDRVIG
jgi:hypothetical protein